MVNERVGASDWESGQELGDTWASRNSFSYGRCSTPAHHMQRLPAARARVLYGIISAGGRLCRCQADSCGSRTCTHRWGLKLHATQLQFSNMIEGVINLLGSSGIDWPA